VMAGGSIVWAVFMTEVPGRETIDLHHKSVTAAPPGRQSGGSGRSSALPAADAIFRCTKPSIGRTPSFCNAGAYLQFTMRVLSIQSPGDAAY
jgi:hypothetical protein